MRGYKSDKDGWESWLCWGGPCCLPLRPYQNGPESWIPTSVSPTVYLGPQISISERYSPGSLVLIPQAVIETCMEPRKGSRSAVLWGLSSHPLLPHTDSALALLQPTLPQTSAFPHIIKQRRALPFSWSLSAVPLPVRQSALQSPA